MGNSCTREADVVLSERGVGGARGRRHDRARGRWSQQFEGSVDLDTLLEAPSPPANGRRRRKSRPSKNEKSHRAQTQPPTSLPQSGAFGGRNNSRSKKGSRKFFSRNRSAIKEEEEDEGTYRSYEDPGCMSNDPIALMHLDSDLILQSPMDSPVVIHARWGEPVDDPEEAATCSDFQPNPFKLGFCINCQKQHDVGENGDVASKKEYKKIARPAVSKTAASALDNPNAVLNITPRDRESDVDLAALLKQRRDILLKLTKLEQEKARMTMISDAKLTPIEASTRHTMFLGDPNGTSLANLRRMGSTGRASTSGPSSTRGLPRTSSVLVSPRGTQSLRGMSKSISLGTYLNKADDEPARNDWL